MKNKLILIGVIFLSTVLLTGCSSKNSSKESIESAKKEVEQIINDFSLNYDSMSQEAFEGFFYAFGRDFLLSIEEKNKNGDMIYVEFSEAEIDGKKIGTDSNNERIHYIYLGNEKYEDLWAYGTIDLHTKKISWEMGY